MKTSLDILKSWFQKGDKPTENQFKNLIDSFHHKDDGNIITNYKLADNGNISFTLSDGNTATFEKFVLPNTMPKNFIDGLVETLNNKVTSETGKQLSDENFTIELKQKLDQLKNYIHPEFHQITEIQGLQEAIEAKVDKVIGKQLSDENFSTEEKEKLTSLENYKAPDSRPITYVENLEDTLNELDQKIAAKVDSIDGKQLSDENFSTEEKEKLANFDITTFSSITDGENTMEAKGQADRITFEGATIDSENNKVIINSAKNLSELNNDVPYALKGDPLTRGNIFQIIPQQVGFVMTRVGAIKVNIPKEIQLNALSIHLDISTGYQGPDRISANIIINTFIYENQQTKGGFHTQSARIIASDSKYDFNVRFQQGEEACIYIGELDTDFRFANVAITKLIGYYNGTLDEVELSKLQKGFTIQHTDSFGTITKKLSNNLIQGKTDDTKVDKIAGKQLSANDYTTEEKEKLAAINLNSFSSVSDGKNTILASKQNDTLTFKGANINPANNSISIDTNGQNIFPDFNFSWGNLYREYTKNHYNNTSTSYSGNVNLLECELINGIDDLLDYEPKILLYRYKSKKKLYYHDETLKKAVQRTKKAGFYHYEGGAGRNTIISLKSKKPVLDFGLENFFKDGVSSTTSKLFAQGMKNSNSNTLYRKKARSQAHFYIKLRLQLKYKGETILSPFSETLRVFIDKHENYKIGYERT